MSIDISKTTLFVIVTLMQTKLWVFGMIQKRYSFSGNDIVIEKLTFPYVLHKTRHHYNRASVSNS